MNGRNESIKNKDYQEKETSGQRQRQRQRQQGARGREEERRGIVRKHSRSDK